MAQTQSPGYPQFALPKAIQGARKIFEADRRNVIDRAVAVRHLGYSGPSGAADKALATLAHFDLVEKAGKGDVRLTQLAVDIIHPETPDSGTAALLEAAFSPKVFKDIRDRFGDHVSRESLESYLLRSNFLNRAIRPVISSYMETMNFLEQMEAFKSSGTGGESGADANTQEPFQGKVFGGAKVGDLVQWESGGALQMEKPTRVRAVSDDGEWVAVEGSETGIPMSEVIVEEPVSAAPMAPPIFKFAAKTGGEEPPRAGETEWMRNKVGKATTVILRVSGGEMGAREIGKLIKLLEAQRAVLADEDDDEDDG